MTVPFIGVPTAAAGTYPVPQAKVAPAGNAAQAVAQSGTVSAFEGMVREFTGAPQHPPQEPQGSHKQAGERIPFREPAPVRQGASVKQAASPQQVAADDSDTAVALPQTSATDETATDKSAAAVTAPDENGADSKVVVPVARFLFPAAKAATGAPEAAAPVSKGTRKAPPSPTKPAAFAPQAPFIGVPVAVPLPPPPPPPTPPPPAPEEREKGHPAVEPKSAERAEHAAPTDTVLQVTLKTPNEKPAPATDMSTPVPAPAKTEPMRAAPEIPVVPAPVTASASATPQPTAVSAPAPTAHPTDPAPKPAEQATETALPPDPPTQQIRSVSLEFTPDGAGDVRLRVTERAGEVHISLHSADASLSGKLHEGVHDLVGSLSGAGYEAEAWTPGHGHSGGQPEQEQRRPQRPQRDDPGDEEFGHLFEQPVQEVS